MSRGANSTSFRILVNEQRPPYFHLVLLRIAEKTYNENVAVKKLLFHLNCGTVDTSGLPTLGIQGSNFNQQQQL